VFRHSNGYEFSSLDSLVVVAIRLIPLPRLLKSFGRQAIDTTHPRGLSKDSWLCARLGSTKSHKIPPAIESTAAKMKAEFQPNLLARYGVSEAVTAPPI
jgi:hypothetical protein